MMNWTGFEKEGINPHDIFIRSLWILGKILNTVPWDDKVLSLTKAQSDLLLALHAHEHPESGILVLTPDQKNEVTFGHQMAAWSNVLRGKALKEFLGVTGEKSSPLKWLKRNQG